MGAGKTAINIQQELCRKKTASSGNFFIPGGSLPTLFSGVSGRSG